MPQLFTNAARSTLQAGILSTDTSLTVETAKADKFPVANTGTAAVPATTGWFKATLQNTAGEIEIVYVRTRAATIAVFSDVIRAREGTTALAFAAGTVVGLRLTAADAEGTVAGVSSVTGTPPIVSSGGATPAISIGAATASVAGSMSAADKTKLDGVATGASANSADAFLLARANHTGTQAASTITGLAAVATSDAKADIGLGSVDNTSDAAKDAATATLTNKTITASGLITANAGLTVAGALLSRGGGAVVSNVSVGVSALAQNTSGSLNTAVGSNAVAYNITGADNTAVGAEALFSTTGSFNTAVGSLALRAQTTSSFNVAVGGLPA